MRVMLVLLGFLGAALLARGVYGMFLLESANEIGLETMSAVEIGFGVLITVCAIGFVEIVNVLHPIPAVSKFKARQEQAEAGVSKS